MKRTATILAAFFVGTLMMLAAPLLHAQANALVVQDAWARKAPGSDVAAVYLSLRNTSAQPMIVVGVRSPGAASAMIHETSVQGGQSQMRPKDKIVIAPGQTVTLQPGGTHIMLSGFKSNYGVGQSVPLVLLLANGEQVQAAAVVRPLTAN
ncbi:MAG TPA: copper chaperone PCu(A)C [Steroidobacteraceae bacterium]